MAIKQKIVEFFLDEEQDWIAILRCGHRQHVRHDPPWQNREWVISRSGRDSMLGHELNCKECSAQVPD